MPGTTSPRILVIKLGALGDVVQAMGAFQAIRQHHAGAEITLLTTDPFADFAAASRYFDHVWDSGRPAAMDLVGWLALRRRIRGGDFDRVYDLQTSDRSSFYFHLFRPGPPPEWSGIAAGCSHPHGNPNRDFMHTADRLAEQLAATGITDVPAPDLSWATADIAEFGLNRRYALLVPGGAAHRPAKRWPLAHFAELARALDDKGICPVILGTADEAAVTRAVARAHPGAFDLTGRTSLLQLAELGRHAALAVGNDTGPMHVFAAVGCPATVLYSHASDPALCAQRGPAVTIVRRPSLDSLTTADVLGELTL